MAASFHLLSPSLSNFMKGQVGVRLYSEHCLNCITFFHNCRQKQNCNIKLYMVPGKAIAHHHWSRQFASIGSPETNVDVSSGVSDLDDFQRYKTLLEHSSSHLNGINDFERQLQELFEEVKTMIMMGNKNDAIDLLQANYEAVKEQINAGTKGIEEAAILDIIALGYMAIGDLNFVGYLLNMMSEVVDCLKNEEPLLDGILVHMGSMYSRLGKFEKSILVYRRVISILENIYGKDSTFLITPLLGTAKVLGSVGRVRKAVEIYHRVITILESNRGAESEDLVLPLFGLGNLLIKEGKAVDAESAFIRIQKIYTKKYGEHDGRVGLAMCSLAHANCAKGNTDEAIDLYKKGLQVIKDSKYMTLDDSIMEKMRIDLAELLHVVGRGKEGRELLEECLLITENYKGREHPSSVTHLINLATSYSQSKNFVEAERLLRTSLEIMMKTVGPDDQSITFPMLQLGVTLYRLNRVEEAEKLVLEVLRTREKAFGKDSLPVGEALDCLVAIQIRLGKDEVELLEMLKRVLRIQEKEFGNDSEEVMSTLKKVVFYLNKLGRNDEKIPLLKRLSNLRMKYKQKIAY
ncbi:nephrocystin-3 [Mangifera indica]|uniref:nephrocystin-3 n=1 Tax=Mangifera indica TaxID=29780 RepID=UPI001CF9A184|nr:nephrocystin-3 [Mangifera indica]